jgi:glycosyltransferase involved in cell wall biosynthesis
MRKLSLIIPVYNEERNLAPLVKTLLAVKWPVACEWIMIDDASRDGSLAALRTLAKKHSHIRVVGKRRNEGKGAAIATGIELASGDLIAVQDADLEYDPNDLVQLMQPILEGKADVVYGSRFRRDGRQVHRTFHRFVNVLLTALSNLCSGIHLTDMESCYKVFRADVVKRFQLRSRRFSFEPEVTAYIAKFPLRILEFPVAYYPRNYLEGKKIGWRDGVSAVWAIFKYNFLVGRRGCLKLRRMEDGVKRAA